MCTLLLILSPFSFRTNPNVTTCNMIQNKSTTFNLGASLLDRDSAPKETCLSPVTVWDSATQQNLSLPGRIHSWTTVLVSENSRPLHHSLTFLAVGSQAKDLLGERLRGWATTSFPQQPRACRQNPDCGPPSSPQHKDSK